MEENISQNQKLNGITKVVNVKTKNIRPDYLNLHEWIQDKDSNVYIGRGRVIFINGVRYPLQDSIWANPYKITEKQTRNDVLNLYREYIDKKLKSNPFLITELMKLEGKNLGCWCSPEPCHGDILLELIEKYKTL
jgi:hypothetical protein